MPRGIGKISTSKKPLPHKEASLGSKKNKPGGDSSENSSKNIVLSSSVKNTLKRKLVQFKERYPRVEKVSLDDLKMVYRSGAGDNTTTHKEGVRSNRSALGIARVNKFLEKVAGKQRVKSGNLSDGSFLHTNGAGETEKQIALPDSYAKPHTLKRVLNSQGYDIVPIYKQGGEVNPEDKLTKNAITHKAGAAGGMLVGRRHSEGGIKAINKSNNQPIEMEGGEVVITRDAVSDETKYEFEGEMLTNRQILSMINESGGGVSFADGGDIPCEICYHGTDFKYGGKTMKDIDIIREMQVKYPVEFKKGWLDEYQEHKTALELLDANEINTKTASRIIAAQHLKTNPDYYSKYEGGGLCHVCHKTVPSYKAYLKANDLTSGPMSEAHYRQELLNVHRLDFDKQPLVIQIALMSGNQELIDKYLKN